jgi:hypothetical protein
MITVYRTKNGPAGDWVEAEFKALVVGYRRVLLTAEEAAAQFGSEVDLPVITDKETLVYGRESLIAYFQRLEKFVSDWRLFQSDACYINDEGEIC